MTEHPTPIASLAAGQIAIQTMLSVLANMYVGLFADGHDKIRAEMLAVAENIVDRGAIPDLPEAEQQAARTQAKFLLKAMIGGVNHH